MSQIKSLGLNIFMVAAIIHMMSIVSDNALVMTVTKYALMPALMLHVYVNRTYHAKGYKSLLAALFFSWMGDAFLLYDDVSELYFMLGLGSFLLAHVWYIFAFRKHMFSGDKANSIKYWLVLPIIYAAILMSIIGPHLADMLIPVSLYAIVITLMSIFAILRFGHTSSYSFRFVMIGAISFILSDSMIAWNTFYQPFEYASLIIMISYIIAQYLLVTGLMLHQTTEEAKPEQAS